MGERVHFLGIPCGQAKGGSHEGYHWSYARDRVTCGGCKNTLAFRANRAFPHPTVLHMKGGETGEDACGGLAFADSVALIVDLCTAPTPEAP